MIACPKCGNDRENKTLNFCTICDKPHVDMVCSKCNNRFSHEIAFKENPLEDNQPAVADAHGA